MESDNPSTIWDCDCSLYYLKKFIREEAENIITDVVYDGSFLVQHYNLQSWKCRASTMLEPEAQIKPFLDTSDEKFICFDRDLPCPKDCTCYRGAHNLNIYVDCSHLALVKMPRNLPVPSGGGQLHVNLANNNIGQYEDCRDPDYMWLQNATKLDLEHNGFTPKNSDHTDNFLHCLTSVQYLYMAYNNIEYLPLSIQYIDYKNLSISGNKLKCDCTTLWLKQWLQKNNDTIQKSQTMRCKGFGK